MRRTLGRTLGRKLAPAQRLYSTSVTNICRGGARMEPSSAGVLSGSKFSSGPNGTASHSTVILKSDT